MITTLDPRYLSAMTDIVARFRSPSGTSERFGDNLASHIRTLRDSSDDVSPVIVVAKAACLATIEEVEITSKRRLTPDERTEIATEVGRWYSAYCKRHRIRPTPRLVQFFSTTPVIRANITDELIEFVSQP